MKFKINSVQAVGLKPFEKGEFVDKADIYLVTSTDVEEGEKFHSKTDKSTWFVVSGKTNKKALKPVDEKIKIKKLVARGDKPDTFILSFGSYVKEYSVKKEKLKLIHGGKPRFLNAALEAAEVVTGLGAEVANEIGHDKYGFASRNVDSSSYSKEDTGYKDLTSNYGAIEIVKQFAVEWFEDTFGSYEIDLAAVTSKKELFYDKISKVVDTLDRYLDVEYGHDGDPSALIDDPRCHSATVYDSEHNQIMSIFRYSGNASYYFVFCNSLNRENFSVASELDLADALENLKNNLKEADDNIDANVLSAIDRAIDEI